jgi:hypothetical protein
VARLRQTLGGRSGRPLTHSSYTTTGDTTPFFRTQSFTASRLIDPTQYDWPVNHFGARRLPWQPNHPPFPLPFRAARARQLSLAWRNELNAANFPLTLETNHSVQKVTLLEMGTDPNITRTLEVILDDGRVVQAGAIIDAKGFGVEKCRIEVKGSLAFEGFPFWGPDTFDQLDPDRHHVLISGSGDGALQDYLRVVTHLPSAADIVLGCNLPLSVISGVQSAEDRSLRGWSWASDDPTFRAPEENPYFDELDKEHRREVLRALSYPQVRAGLARIVPRRVVETHVIYREPYITAYYGLNRFLALLLSEFIQQRDWWRALYPETSINTIETDKNDQHDCIDSGSKRAKGTYDATNAMLLIHQCFEKRHKVTFNGSTTPNGSTPPGPEMLYNVVIVRHGLLEPPRPQLKRTRHLLPYHRA